MEKELQGLEGGPEVMINLELLGETLKKVPNGKIPGHYNIYRFWFKKFTSLHDRLVLELNRCLEETNIPEWMTKRETTLNKKTPQKESSSVTIDR